MINEVCWLTSCIYVRFCPLHHTCLNVSSNTSLQNSFWSRSVYLTLFQYYSERNMFSLLPSPLQLKNKKKKGGKYRTLCNFRAVDALYGEISSWIGTALTRERQSINEMKQFWRSRESNNDWLKTHLRQYNKFTFHKEPCVLHAHLLSPPLHSPVSRRGKPPVMQACIDGRRFPGGGLKYWQVTTVKANIEGDVSPEKNACRFLYIHLETNGLFKMHQCPRFPN